MEGGPGSKDRAVYESLIRARAGAIAEISQGVEVTVLNNCFAEALDEILVSPKRAEINIGHLRNGDLAARTVAEPWGTAGSGGRRERQTHKIAAFILMQVRRANHVARRDDLDYVGPLSDATEHLLCNFAFVLMF